MTKAWGTCGPGCTYINLDICGVTASASTAKAYELFLARCRVLGVYGVCPVRVGCVYLDREGIPVAHLASELPPLPTLYIHTPQGEGAGLQLGGYCGACGGGVPDCSRDVGGSFLD